MELLKADEAHSTEDVAAVATVEDTEIPDVASTEN
jgi:hypothetical protein